MDKRRYLPRSPRGDKPNADHGTGNAAKDGFSTRHRCPLPGTEEPYSYRRKDSLHSENYAADSLMTEDEARFDRMYGSAD